MEYNITDATFDEETKEGLVLIDFWATWCGPCMRLLPKMEELAEKYKGKVMFYKIRKTRVSCKSS